MSQTGSVPSEQNTLSGNSYKQTNAVVNHVLRSWVASRREGNVESRGLCVEGFGEARVVGGGSFGAWAHLWHLAPSDPSGNLLLSTTEQPSQSASCNQ